jgi:hypothetical protein
VTKLEKTSALLDVSNRTRDTFNGIWNGERAKVARGQTDLFQAARNLKDQLQWWRTISDETKLRSWYTSTEGIRCHRLKVGWNMNQMERETAIECGPIDDGQLRIRFE